MDEPLSPAPNGIVLTLPQLHRAAAAKLRARKDPDAAELAEPRRAPDSLLQEPKVCEDRCLRGNSDVETAEETDVPRSSN